VGLFRPYKQNDSAASPQATQEEEVASQTPDGKKGRPTPSREQAQAARMAAIHPKLTKKELRAKEREVENRKRTEDWEKVENQPERVLMRNYVDSRWTFTELMWPLLLIMLAGSLLASAWPPLLVITTFLLYGVVLLSVVNIIWVWFGFKKMLAARYPDRPTKGLLWSMISRMVTLRRVRNPAPAIKRGEAF
jgi:hypothetical protein